MLLKLFCDRRTGGPMDRRTEKWLIESRSTRLKRRRKGRLILLPFSFSIMVKSAVTSHLCFSLPDNSESDWPKRNCDRFYRWRWFWCIFFLGTVDRGIVISISICTCIYSWTCRNRQLYNGFGDSTDCTFARWSVGPWWLSRKVWKCACMMLQLWFSMLMRVWIRVLCSCPCFHNNIVTQCPLC